MTHDPKVRAQEIREELARLKAMNDLQRLGQEYDAQPYGPVPEAVKPQL